MINDLIKLSEALDKKVKPLVEAIENADPTKEEYGILISNFDVTMTLANKLGRTLNDFAEKVEEIKKGEEDNGTNN